jgi:hypothetical protein
MAIAFEIENGFTNISDAALSSLIASLRLNIRFPYISNHLLLLNLIRAIVARFKA